MSHANTIQQWIPSVVLVVFPFVVKFVDIVLLRRVGVAVTVMDGGGSVVVVGVVGFVVVVVVVEVVVVTSLPTDL